MLATIVALNPVTATTDPNSILLSSTVSDAVLSTEVNPFTVIFPPIVKSPGNDNELDQTGAVPTLETTNICPDNPMFNLLKVVAADAYNISPVE